MQELIGIEVFSKRYGKGKIVSTIDNHFVVAFATEKKTYVYPLAFEKGLEVDEQIKIKALTLLNTMREEEETRKRQEDEERRKNSIKPISFNGGRFKPDYNFEHLQKQPILTYQEVEQRFGINLTGFGKGINTSRFHSNIVLISVISKEHGFFVYHDHWTPEGDYIYSGEGKSGDQVLNRGNRAIINAKRENKTIHLFVKFSPQEYFYQGIFELADYTYEDDFGEDKKMRKEYKFRLKRRLQ